MRPGSPPCALVAGELQAVLDERLLDDLLHPRLGLPGRWLVHARLPDVPPSAGRPPCGEIRDGAALMGPAVVGHRPAIAGQQTVDGVIPGEPPGVVDGRPAQRASASPSSSVGDRRGPMPGSCPSTRVPLCPSATATGRPPTDAATTGVPQVLRLDGDQPEGFRIARHRHQVSSAIDVHQVLTGLRRQERHPVGDGQVVGQP